MKMRGALPLLGAFFFMVELVVPGRAIVPSLDWTGAIDSSLSTPGNWHSGTAPSGGEDLVFSAPANPQVTFPSAFTANSLAFTGTSPSYSLSGNSSALGLANGITLDAGGHVSLNYSLPVQLLANQTWTTNGDLEVNGTISGNYVLTKTGTGALYLSSSNPSLTGGVTVAQGALYLGYSNSAGTGTLTLQSGTTLGSDSYYTNGVSLSNNVVLTDNVTIASKPSFSYYNYNNSAPSLTLQGMVTADASSTHVHLEKNSPLAVEGTLTGTTSNTAVIFDHGTATEPQGVVVLDGTTSSNIGNLTADGVALMLASAGSIPTAGSLQVLNNGYLGIGASQSNTPPAAADVLARITDKANFNGTFGFDTDPNSSAAYVYTDNLDLSGFDPAKFTLGSATRATLQGTITPPAGGDYKFGGGGGNLRVESALVDNGSTPRAVSVASPLNQELTLVLAGTNTYTGGTVIDNSLLRFAGPGALPATGGIQIITRGYLGFDYDVDLAALIPRISVVSGAQLLLGFDAPAGVTARVIDQPVDLTGLPADTILGTSTNLYLLGAVTPAGGSGAPWRFSAVKGGTLNIVTPLTGNRALVVGFPNLTTDETSGFGEARPNQGSDTVALWNQNSFSGGTTLQGGLLQLANPGALGTGALTVTDAAGLQALNYNLELTNSVQLLNGTNPAILHLSGSNGFTLSGQISGNGSLSIDGNYSASYRVSGANTFTGGVNLNSGTLEVGNDQALGDASSVLNFAGGTLVNISVDRTIANPVQITNYAYISADGGTLTFSGPVTLANSGSFSEVNLRGSSPVFFTGSVNETNGSHQLYVYGSSALVLAGDNTGSSAFSGGAEANGGALVFLTPSSLPLNPATAAFRADSSGYIGIGFTTFASGHTLQTDFLNRFDQAGSSGVIGFDTDPAAGSTNTFTDPIDLTGFNTEARLGSLSSARLTGTITPQSGAGAYQFGGGGGFLEVGSVLSDGASASLGVSVDSTSSAPLTVRLTGANTFTGNVNVSDSALIFANGALPAETGPITASSHGYIGTESTSFGNFINRLSWEMTDGVVGFDSFTGSPYVISANDGLGAPQTVDLSHFYQSTDPNIFLGTTTQAEIDAAIQLPNAQTTYRFAGYKGGQLTVGSTLIDITPGDSSTSVPTSVQIGDPDSPATQNNPTSSTSGWSTVTLTGTNSYTGGTTLYAGRLIVSNAGALGATSGALTIEATNFGRGEYAQSVLPSSPYYYPPQARLEAGTAGLSIANDVILNADLEVGGSNDFNLSGVISGSNGILKTDTNNLTLSNGNTFTGGIYVQQGSITFAHDDAAGAGPLAFGGPLNPSAAFTTGAPVVGPLLGDTSGDHLDLAAASAVLTVNETSDTKFMGVISDSGGNGALNVTNTYFPYSNSNAQLYLGGANTYTGGTTVNTGVTVIGGNNAAFGTGAVTLSGGKIAADNGVTVTNPLVLTAGQIGGTGTFAPDLAPVISGVSNARVVLAPGKDGTGTLHFGAAGLILGAGGAYNWEVADASTPGAADSIVVAGPVDITASTIAPFHLKLISIDFSGNAGLVANFDPNRPYTWTILSAASIGHFSADKFLLEYDPSLFQNALNVGGFYLSLDSSGTQLLLNFTPVPEPSTYALMGLGLIALWWQKRRRRS